MFYTQSSGQRVPVDAADTTRLLKWRLSTFWVMLVGYIGYYLCRGNLSAAWVASNVPRLTTSGDVHIAVYDLAPDTAAAYLAIGTTAANGSFVRYAYEAPFLRFASKAIFAVPPPASA